jgi:hypothetical protein
VGTGFRKRSCANKKLEPNSDSTKNDRALAAAARAGHEAEFKAPDCFAYDGACLRLGLEGQMDPINVILWIGVAVFAATSVIAILFLAGI